MTKIETKIEELIQEIKEDMRTLDDLSVTIKNFEDKQDVILEIVRSKKLELDILREAQKIMEDE